MKLGNMVALVIVLITVTVFIAMGALVMDQVQDEGLQMPDKDSTTDEVTALLNTEVDLTGEHYVTISTVKNVSTTLDSSNYTLSNSDFKLLESSYNNTKLNVTNNYYSENYAYNVTGEGLSATDTVAGFLPVVGIVIIAAIIISIIARHLGRTGL